MSDSSGNSLGAITYQAFGSARGGSMPTDKKFTGQRLDATGLYYYGARYYDPGIGRFISADTFMLSPSNPQGLNRYTYVFNNPSTRLRRNMRRWYSPSLVTTRQR
ncbi:MAG: RHS repeat-associated core domain-containing protein [Chloroflexi bacterium]|nr:RHS repeat-associated core domain-containing protein [Chloroflexota bacterium]